MGSIKRTKPGKLRVLKNWSGYTKGDIITLIKFENKYWLIPDKVFNDPLCWIEEAYLGVNYEEIDQTPNGFESKEAKALLTIGYRQ